MSPAYPQNYPGGLECLYIIAAEVGKIITFEIEDLDLDPTKDYILIRNGNSPNSPEMAKLTGSAEENNRIIMSTKNQVYVYFKTNLGDSRRGFKIKYSEGKFSCKTQTLFILNYYKPKGTRGIKKLICKFIICLI